MTKHKRTEPHPGDKNGAAREAFNTAVGMLGTAMQGAARRAGVLSEIARERNRQVEQWGDAHDDTHTNYDWVAFLARYVGQGVSWPFDGPAFRTAMIKVAAVAMAAVEWYDRNKDSLEEGAGGQTYTAGPIQVQPEVAEGLGGPPLGGPDQEAVPAAVTAEEVTRIVQQALAEERERMIRQLEATLREPRWPSFPATPSWSAEGVTVIPYAGTTGDIRPGPTGTAGGNWPAPGVYEARIASVPADTPVRVRYTELTPGPRHVTLASQAGVGDTYDYDDLPPPPATES